MLIVSCKSEIILSNMGVVALRSHASRKWHSTKMRGLASQSSIASALAPSNRAAFSTTSVGIIPRRNVPVVFVISSFYDKSRSLKLFLVAQGDSFCCSKMSENFIFQAPEIGEFWSGKILINLSGRQGTFFFIDAREP